MPDPVVDSTPKPPEPAAGAPPPAVVGQPSATPPVSAPVDKPGFPSEGEPRLPGEVSRDTNIAIPMEDGQSVSVSLGELADTFLSFKQSGLEKLDSEELRVFNLWQRASKNDPEALREYVKTLFPDTEGRSEGAPAASVSSSVLDELRREMTELRDLFQREVNPVVRGIRGLADIQQVSAAIQSKADRLPGLAAFQKVKGPEAAQRVVARKAHYEEQLKAHGTTFDHLPAESQKKVWEKAFLDVESELTVMRDVFGGTPRAVQGTPPLLDDQGQPAPSNIIRARWGIDPRTGRMIDRHAPPPAPVPGGTIPETPVPIPSGTAPSLSTPQPEGPLTEQRLREILRGQRVKMEGVL